LLMLDVVTAEVEVVVNDAAIKPMPAAMTSPMA